MQETFKDIYSPIFIVGFPGGSDGKEFTCRAGDLGMIPGLGRSPGKVKGYPLLYSGQGNSMYRGAWQTTVRGVTKSEGLTGKLRPRDFK